MRILANAALLAASCGFAITSAADGTRAGKWEFTLQPQYTESVTIAGSNGSSAEIEDEFGFGFGLAYNLNDHLSIGGEFAWTQADYKTSISPAAGNPGANRSTNGELYSTTLRMNATWNLFSGPLTPFITGGVGATYVDSSVPDGPPNSFCWYDPWWGYYCGVDQPTKNDTYFSYMGGAGVRWDATESFFLRGVAVMQWLDVGGAVGTPEFTQYRIDIGFKF